MVPQLFLDREKCTGCGTCVSACPEQAITVVRGKSQSDRALCKSHGKCAEVCPNGARSLMGRHTTAGEVFDDVAGDLIFYRRSGGGVTLSGGEPLAQPKFVISVLQLCKDAGMHTAIETCGYANWGTLKQVLNLVDLVMYDLKHLDSASHEKCVGVPNALILDNLRRIHHEFSIPIHVRVPVIPGYNDSSENIEATARFIATELDNSVEVYLLPYHRLGESKYERLEKPAGLVSISPPEEESMQQLLKVIEEQGLIARIGG
jgi:pyruvate formate lyase activating enzyme